MFSSKHEYAKKKVSGNAHRATPNSPNRWWGFYGIIMQFTLSANNIPVVIIVALYLHISTTANPRRVVHHR